MVDPLLNRLTKYLVMFCIHTKFCLLRFVQYIQFLYGIYRRRWKVKQNERILLLNYILHIPLYQSECTFAIISQLSMCQNLPNLFVHFLFFVCYYIKFTWLDHSYPSKHIPPCLFEKLRRAVTTYKFWKLKLL